MMEDKPGIGVIQLIGGGPPLVVWKISPVAVDPKNPDTVYTRSYRYKYKNKSVEGDLARGVWNGQNMSWERLGLLDRVIDSLDGTPLDSLDKLPLNVTKIVIDQNHPEIIYAGVGGLSEVSHIWRSIDSGKTWEDITYNLPRQGVGGMAINPHSGELMIGSFYGTWIFPPPYESKNLIYNKAVSRPSCHDGLKNGDETGIDSGGSCYKPHYSNRMFGHRHFLWNLAF